MTQRVLFLGSDQSPLYTWLQGQEGDVLQTEDKISADFIVKNKVSFIVSYGYRHKLINEVLELLPNKAINLHISYLPWNRGADPNLWSFILDTPKGVTIHYIDEGLDTGDIIVQQKVDFDLEKDTLASSYHKLQQSIQTLFKRHWQEIKDGAAPCQPQIGSGSTQRVSDKKKVECLLSKGWDTPIAELIKFKGSPD